MPTINGLQNVVVQADRDGSSPADGDVPQYDATAGMWVATPAPVLESAWVQITNAEFKALNGTPKTLVAAGGAGVVRIPVKWLLYFKTMVTAYATGGVLTLIGSVHSEVLITDEITATYVVDEVATNDGVIVIAVGDGTPLPPYLEGPAGNQAIVLKASVDFTSGNAGNVIYAKVWYSEVTLP